MSKARAWPRGWQMPGPRATQNYQMPAPGTDKTGKCPAVARKGVGGKGGGGWAQLELTDALLYAVLIVIITPLNHCPYFCKD